MACKDSRVYTLGEFKEYLEGKKLDKIAYENDNQSHPSLTLRPTIHFRQVFITTPHCNCVRFVSDAGQLLVCRIQKVRVTPRPRLGYDIVTFTCDSQGIKERYTFLFDYEL